MSGKIEPGCLAMGISGCPDGYKSDLEWHGAVVRITGKTGSVWVCGCAGWNHEGSGVFAANWAPECALLRIDGDPDAVTEDETQEVEA